MTNEESKVTSGSCFCGAVRYEVRGPLRDVVNCHCGQCTRLNGNFGSHSKALKSKITIISDKGLSWYTISDTARRGFCRDCGSGLFWDHIEQDAMGIIAGSLDRPTNLKTIGHIFVEDKSDFYEITDDIQQFKGSSNGQLAGDYL
ncbi:GFA family protein [Exilibacterium tricleocarpae]|uniref:GFA family protein n=1 Tax=Exilibacterium tricleocarpae TaxID=2591008 RepID=A0A545ST09_9GAMM|nr:GFA family protein [Exilibacterium tricleocarpae]TQV68118.1 GFA family protein [Exilibacterium tricleocarpae]